MFLVDFTCTLHVKVLCFKLGPGSNRYITEITRLRLQYDEAKRKLSNLKYKLANIEDQMIPGQNESDKDR